MLVSMPAEPTFERCLFRGHSSFHRKPTNKMGATSLPNFHHKAPSVTPPETNSSHLKMVVSNRNLLFQGGPFSDAFAVSFRETTRQETTCADQGIVSNEISLKLRNLAQTVSPFRHEAKHTAIMGKSSGNLRDNKVG